MRSVFGKLNIASRAANRAHFDVTSAREVHTTTRTLKVAARSTGGVVHRRNGGRIIGGRVNASALSGRRRSTMTGGTRESRRAKH